MRTTKLVNVAKNLTLALACSLCLTGFLPGAATALPYQVSADGDEVTDQGTGLIWRRCVEGMSWDGATCIGTPGDYTHGQAPQQAVAQAAATGKGWRLPNSKELAGIDDIFKTPPVIDPATFPANPPGWYWSVSPNVGYKNYETYVDFVAEYFNFSYAWYVNYLNDSVHGYNHGLTKYVRLVRNGQ